MRKVITINIPEPCHEDWNKMTPKDQGRHCASCNKTVVDFTKQTDEQIIKSLETIGNLCGRFKAQQIDRDIVLARKDKNNYLSLAASGLFAFLAFGNQDVYAQGTPKPIQTDTSIRPMIKGKVATSILLEQKIYGTITDAEEGLPLVGVNIVIKGTIKKIATDFDGNYALKVKKGAVLVISYLGYISQEIKIDHNKHIDIQLKPTEMEILGEVNYVAGGIRVIDQHIGIPLNPDDIQQLNVEQERTAFGKFLFGIKRLFSKK